MSRLRLVSDPSDAALADELSPLRFDNYAGDVTMPGCHQRCCGGRRDAWSDWMVERLEWQISGADLVPILAVVLLAMLACAVVWRDIGGLP